MNGDRGIAIPQADHQPHRNPISSHRVDETPAEFIVAASRSERPTDGVNHLLKRAGKLPDLLDPERIGLGVRAREAKMCDRSLREVSLRSLPQDSGPRQQI